MSAGPRDVAQLRLENALLLFEEFVRSTARHADAATLRGLERRFAERVQIQPSYWSQIKSRSRQIGERLARQFEQLCHKPYGWMDVAHDGTAGAAPVNAAVQAPGAAAADNLPRDDDERFIVGLVLTYYRRHPQRARTRLLDLLGEVLTPSQDGAPLPATLGAAAPPGPRAPATPGVGARAPAAPAAPARSPSEEAHALWLRSQTGVAPLKRRK